jgi:hypothetical protein
MADILDSEIAQVDWKNPDQVIDFYEENRLYFENAERITDKEKISQIIDIKLHYANSQFDKSHYDIVLTVVDQARQLLVKLDNNHWNYEQSERHIRFLRGMVLGQKKRFRESYPIFKQLIKEDQDHHHYKVWFQHSKIGLYNWIFSITTGLGLGLLLMDMFFLIILKKPLPVDLATIGMILMGLTLIIRTGVNQYIKRKKTTHNTNHQNRA